MRVENLTGRVLVDTNVLIYATLATNSRHEKAREVLSLRHRPEIEMYPNLTGPKNQPPDSPSLAPEDLYVAGNIIRQNYFDRQLAALMLREGIPVILTENA